MNATTWWSFNNSSKWSVWDDKLDDCEDDYGIAITLDGYKDSILFDMDIIAGVLETFVNNSKF